MERIIHGDEECVNAKVQALESHKSLEKQVRFEKFIDHFHQVVELRMVRRGVWVSYELFVTMNRYVACKSESELKKSVIPDMLGELSSHHGYGPKVKLDTDYDENAAKELL